WLVRLLLPRRHLRQILRPVLRFLHRVHHLPARQFQIHRQTPRRRPFPYLCRLHPHRDHQTLHQDLQVPRRPFPYPCRLHPHRDLQTLHQHRQVPPRPFLYLRRLHPRQGLQTLHQDRQILPQDQHRRRGPQILHQDHQHLRLRQRISPLPTNFRRHPCRRSSSSPHRFPTPRLVRRHRIPVRTRRRLHRPRANFLPPGSVAVVYWGLQKCREACRLLHPELSRSIAPPL